MGKLNGKIAVVTGGSSGLGLATAKLFVEEGAYVFITGRRQAEIDKAVSSIGHNVTGVQGDTSKAADLDRLYAQIKAEKGTLDIVFANAGHGTMLPLAEITETQYDETFDTNVKGVLLTVQKALPLLKDGSAIVLNASIVANKGAENFSIYSATKAAVRNFARGWANDLKSRRIRVNSVSPGVIVTPGYSNLMSDEQIQNYANYTASQTPAGRNGQPEDIARAVLFLASDDASFVNATDLIVDGGFSQI